MPDTPSMQTRIVEFIQELRGLGLPIGVDQGVSFGESFTWIQPLSREEVYNAARATLVNRHEYLEVFDRAFARYWERKRRDLAEPQKMPQAPRHRPEDFERREPGVVHGGESRTAKQRDRDRRPNRNGYRGRVASAQRFFEAHRGRSSERSVERWRAFAGSSAGAARTV